MILAKKNLKFHAPARFWACDVRLHFCTLLGKNDQIMLFLVLNSTFFNVLFRTPFSVLDRPILF